MRRDELTWALNAVLPHCGNTAATNLVGIAPRLRGVFLYATDRYTIGVARIDAGSMALGDAALSKREATDLMRFVRPSRVSEQEEAVELLTAPGELHVGTPDDSAVFETVARPYSFEQLVSRLELLEALPAERADQEYGPDILARFAKAKRNEADRLLVRPRRYADRNGVAIIRSGSDFLGAVAGLTYGASGNTTLAEFFGTEERVA